LDALRPGLIKNGWGTQKRCIFQEFSGSSDFIKIAVGRYAVIFRPTAAGDRNVVGIGQGWKNASAAFKNTLGCQTLHDGHVGIVVVIHIKPVDH
jgi:hypothetical protein